MMDSKTIKEATARIEKNLPFSLPAMCWRFATDVPDGATTVDDEKWVCMFSFVTGISDGDKVCFYQQHTGCGGAGCFFGFKEPTADDPSMLANDHKLKKDVQLGLAFYDSIKARPPKEDYLVWQRVSDLEDGLEVETVNLWVTGHSLAGLVTLANYDRPTNDNVVIPFASGCQSIWTIPFKQQLEAEPKAVVGGMDPAMRWCLPENVVSFAVPTGRLVEMADNVSGSFLEEKSWTDLFQPHS
jgi:hypothetical protein